MATISIIWGTEDVLGACPWLTEEQAEDVLLRLKDKHDCNIGINWDVIYYTASYMYPKEDSNGNTRT